MKKRYSALIMLFAGIGTASLSQGFALANQQAIETATIQTTQGQVQIHQNQGTISQTTSGSASSNELGGTSNSLPSTNAAGLFGSETCRPEKIEVTPCK